MRAVTIALCVTMIAAVGEAGNLALDRFISDFNHPGESIAHPICGVETWTPAQDPRTGATLRWPVFKRCRHLLTITGYTGGAVESPAVKLLGEVIYLTIDRQLFSRASMVSLGAAPPVAIGVPTSHWIPAGCEATLGTTFTLTPDMFNNPFDSLAPPRPPNWALCQQRVMELFVEEYAQHPDVQMLHRLSAALDSLDLGSASALHRLHRARMLLLSPRGLPRIADLLAVLEGTALPSATPRSIAEQYPYRVLPKADAAVSLEARGVVVASFGVAMQMRSATVRLRGGTAPVTVQPCLCFQPLPADKYLMIASVTPSPTFAAIPAEGELRVASQQFDFMFQPPGINARRYWACFRVTTGSGSYTDFHADDAIQKGCKGCV